MPFTFNGPDVYESMFYLFRDLIVAAEDEDGIYNLLTMEVMTQKVSIDILE